MQVIVLQQRPFFMMKIQTSLFKQITPAEQSLLTNIANSPTEAAYRAQAVLYMARGYEFPVILPNEEGNYTYSVFKTATNNSLNNNQIVKPFVPNPTTGVAQLSYNLPTDAQATLTLTDISGSIQQKVLLTGNGTYSLDTRPLSNGLYLYTVQQNGNVILRDKLVVIK